MAAVINYTALVTSGGQKTRRVHGRGHESPALSSSGSNTLIRCGPLRNREPSAWLFCSQAVKHYWSHTRCFASLLSPGAEGGGGRCSGTRYQVGEGQDAVVLSQEVGTEHAAAEG